MAPRGPVGSYIRRRAAAVLAALAIVGVATGSTEASSAARNDSSASPAVTEASRAGRPDPEVFTGDVDDFYFVPDPLPAGRPGELIRVQEVGDANGRVTLRIMYHSRDAQDRDRAVTGIVTYPAVPAPKRGWPVISTAHGTTGLASQCAPSRSGGEAPGWGVDGVRVMTDYIGLGPVGELHPFLSKTAEGNAVIDAVRAVRRLPDAHAGKRWLSIGHSQGGHGAMAAAELAHEYAPELKLVGTVALAPGAMFDRVYGGIDPIVTAILTLMGLYGRPSEHPEIDVTDYVTPEAHQVAASVVETGCLDEITAALIPVALAGAFTADPRTTEPARSIILQNDVGNVRVKKVPLFLASGTLDDRVVIDRVRDLFDRLCTNGQVTELVVVEGANHGSVIPLTSAQVTDFIEDRLARREPVDSCPAGG
jgi:pimeloyl-ACP methyl ester carboxylesterase